MATSKQNSMSHRPLADMHANGVYFDFRIKAALQNERKMNTTQRDKK